MLCVNDPVAVFLNLMSEIIQRGNDSLHRQDRRKVSHIGWICFTRPFGSEPTEKFGKLKNRKMIGWTFYLSHSKGTDQMTACLSS